MYTVNDIEKTYTSKTKTEIINNIINMYCSKMYLNSNLWMLIQVVQILKDVETSANKTKDIMISLCKLVELINKNALKSFNIPTKNIQFMLYGIYEITPKIVFIKEFVTEDVYSYLSILFKNIKDSHDLENSLIIIKHIINTPSKKKDLDLYDCLFLFYLKIIDILHIDKKIKKYITCSKDIFYYRLKKKDRVLRVNLLYYCTYVLVTKKYKNKALTTNSCEYLFRPIHTDDNIKKEMEDLRCNYRKKLETKNVYIADNLSGMTDLEVVKNN